MEPMKRCPQCGKYVAADRTYCMSCGVTLGVRCPDCQAVSPVDAKECTECGHSFVQKKKLRIPIRRVMRKYARPILFALPILLLILTLVAAGYPAISAGQTINGNVVFSHEVTGYDLMLHFLNGDPISITALMEERGLEDVLSLVQALLFGAGVGWLLVVMGLILSICLVACNITRLGRDTCRRLFLPLGVALGGAGVLFALGKVISVILVDTLGRESDVTAVVAWSPSPVLPLALLIAVGIGLLLQTVLYADVFRRVSAEGELSMSRILYIPLALLGRGLRKLWRKVFKSKKDKRHTEDDEPFLAVTPRFSTYIILFIAALVFTQALLSKISNIFFWFMFLLPLIMLVYVLLASRALRVDMRTETVTTEKNTPQTYEFHIGNRSILALPFIEARVSIPQSNSVRCTERLVRLSMAPMTGYTMKNTVTFRFRGTYDIGVRYFYIYDFFRLFRVRVDVESIATVYVMPRRMTPDDALAQAISDSTVRTVRAPLVVDKLEVSDIRDYRNGDSLKSIHWKLSSKSEGFVVKDYNTGTANQTVVFCDLAPHFPDEPPLLPDEFPLHPRKESRADRQATRRARRAEDKLAADRQAKRNSRIKENSDTHALSDEALRERLDSRAAAAERSAGRTDASTAIPRASTARDSALDIPTIRHAASREPVDVHELSDPSFYEDMNEYLADGVVELTIAMVLSELRRGHDVVLLWFDRRSDTGICAYSLRSLDEFESVYHLFATAPLCDLARKGGVADYDVTALTAMTGHLQSVKQLFVVPTLDTAMLSGLSSLPGVADSGNAGSTEVVLYTPEERFKYPAERRAYLEGCREQLWAHGISLTAGSFNISPPVSGDTAGGASHEA